MPPPLAWTRSFPYKGGKVRISRKGLEWKLSFEGREVFGRGPIHAFEALGGIDLGEEEWQVIGAALHHDTGKQASLSKRRS
jgi:hypothetical protein